MSIKDQEERNETKDKALFNNHTIVSQDEWIKYRHDLLIKEKEFTHAGST